MSTRTVDRSGESCGVRPVESTHLAKNERDVGHPLFSGGVSLMVGESVRQDLVVERMEIADGIDP